jgi:putative tryptophan/tyrosine transport system substrate-binding protein
VDRRRFLVTSLAGALAAPLDVDAQQTARVARIGLLSPVTPGHPLTKAFEQTLAERGFVVDKTVRFEARHTAGRGDRLLDFAAELPTPKWISSWCGQAPVPWRRSRPRGRPRSSLSR